MPSNFAEPRPTPVPGELLARVVQRGEHLRLRRRIAIVAIAMSLAAVGTVLPLALTNHSGGRRVVAVSPGPRRSAPETTAPIFSAVTTTPETTTASATAAATTVTPTPTPTTRVTAPTTTRPLPPTSLPQTTTIFVCTYGNQTGCGPNASLTVTVTISPAAPKVGESITFNVTAADPDSLIDPHTCGTGHVFGDEKTVSKCSTVCISPPPETVFRPIRGSVEEQFVHGYAAPGTYKAQFTYLSGGPGGPCSGSPFFSLGTAVVNVTVT